MKKSSWTSRRGYSRSRSPARYPATRWRSVRSCARAGARMGSAWTKPKAPSAFASDVGGKRLRVTACRRSSSIVNGSVLRVPLAGLDTHRHAILRRRQRAGRERIERARRVLRTVEIEHHLPVLRQRCIEKPRRRIRRLAAGQVTKNEPELVAIQERRHAVLLALECEGHLPGSAHAIDVAEQVGNLKLLGLLVRSERRLDAVRGIEWIPLHSRERLPERIVAIANTDRRSIAAHVHPHLHITQHEPI